MPPTDTSALYDKLIPGGLDAFLKDALDQGQSVRAIAARLDSEHGINVVPETVRKWCRARNLTKASA